MPGNKKEFKRDFRNRKRGNFNPQRERSEENKVMHKCAICSQDIQDLSSAIALPDDMGNPAHFDCVLKKIKENETLGEKQQLVYLGSGSFGIVENVSSSNQSPNYKIIKKIDFEERENIPEWRKQMIKLKI
ncbi:MAG: hypothetical protein FWD87_09075 [Spirochaetaceae bacterium]|nr:hypothetical protein [Spirochaetaceae bacterium]